jgi:hypothetical protein
VTGLRAVRKTDKRSAQDPALSSIGLCMNMSLVLCPLPQVQIGYVVSISVASSKGERAYRGRAISGWVAARDRLTGAAGLKIGEADGRTARRILLN